MMISYSICGIQCAYMTETFPRSTCLVEGSTAAQQEKNSQGLRDEAEVRGISVAKQLEMKFELGSAKSNKS